MAYIIAILVPLVALIAFLVLVRAEVHTGRRVLAATRYKLDSRVARAAFILQHVDWGAFTADVTRASLERLAHDLAHGALIAVQALERTLTRVVRTLRTRRGAAALPAQSKAPAAVSRMDAAVTYLKHSVRRSRKAPLDAKTQANDVSPDKIV
ncbi:MAG: hypothetical protein V4480_04590 [Patescibacteria group bacterium]